MFDTCPALDDTFCPDCVSGSPGCEIQDDGNHNYMVIDQTTFVYEQNHFQDFSSWSLVAKLKTCRLLLA